MRNSSRSEGRAVPWPGLLTQEGNLPSRRPLMLPGALSDMRRVPRAPPCLRCRLKNHKGPSRSGPRKPHGVRWRSWHWWGAGQEESEEGTWGKHA